MILLKADICTNMWLFVALWYGLVLKDLGSFPLFLANSIRVRVATEKIDFWVGSLTVLKTAAKTNPICGVYLWKKECNESVCVLWVC